MPGRRSYLLFGRPAETDWGLLVQTLQGGKQLGHGLVELEGEVNLWVTLT